MTRDVRAFASNLARRPIEPDIQLILSPDVARTLLQLTASVMGPDYSTYRRDTDRIFNALIGAGVEAESGRFKGLVEAQSVPDENC